MNNFLLNNTSVYLGGQCQWDIVLNKVNNQLEIGGFQLSPISNSVAYNKKGDVATLNDNHSDTIKNFHNKLKESFWDTDFHPTTNSTYTESGDTCAYSYDSSLLTGLKRLSSYNIYNKQFCFFQPVWLEQIKNGEFLRFKFTVHPASNPGVVLGAKYLDFKLKENSSEDLFHNKFINYINDWFNYIGIGGVGNNRVSYIDLRNERASISGVSILSGQINNNINCDYVVSNLLMYERPNVETDYILSTLFKSHNVITSQLFNFNFCFNIEDILDEFIFQQLYGVKLYASCELQIVDEATNTTIETIEHRTLFTNYEYINRLSYNPFIFVDDMTRESTGLLLKDYELLPTEVVDENVLSYLEDYEVGSVKDINKLTQNICHWNYVGKKNKNFNLYNGYQYMYYDYGNIDDIQIDVDHGVPYYRYTPHPMQYTNDISIPFLEKSYKEYGDLTWLYPVSALYINSNHGDKTDTDNIKASLSKIYNKGSRGLLYKNSLTIEIVNSTWGTNTDLPAGTILKNVSRIACVYIKKGSISTANVKTILTGMYKTDNILSSGDDQDKLLFCKDDNIGVIFTTDPKFLLLENIISAYEQNSADRQQWSIDMYNMLKCIKRSIIQGNNGDFYQFNTEICVGQNDLNEKQYYKSDIVSTFLYRSGGQIFPAIIQESGETDFPLNNIYYLNDSKQIIDKQYFDDVFEDVFEISEPLCVGWSVFLSNNLRFTLTKDIDDNTPLKDMIKDQLKNIYKNSQENIDDIYNRYFVEFDYEYEYDNIETTSEIKGIVIYKIKLTLR